MINGRTRLSLVEYGSSVDLSSTIVEITKVDRLTADQILVNSGLRIAKYLGMKSNPINVEPKSVRAVDIAGILSISPSLELEIAPKFLGLSDQNLRWREDFFFLATLSRHGQLLANEHLSSSGGTVRDLSTLVARAFSSMYKSQRHRPLRTYRRQKLTDFSFEGDPDPVDIMFPNVDGFEQDVISFDRKNIWNSSIAAAARELLPEVSDVTAGNLLHVIGDLSPQNVAIGHNKKPIPSRHRAWQPLHDLSQDILRGLGLTFKQGQAHAPGYMVSTWQIWEDLISIGLGIGFGRGMVSSQAGFKLGQREKKSSGKKSTSLNVFPDCIIEAHGNRPRFILDSKYKGHIENGSFRISESDIYESLAFSRATRCLKVVLVYPKLANAVHKPLGTCEVFEEIQIDDISITGISVEVRGISKTGALKDFANTLTRDLTSLVHVQD